MGLTALQEKAGGLGTAAGEYRGVNTALRFDDPQSEFAALRTSCGVYDLGYRAKISLAGGDRVRWLNGMVTNNIRDLAVGQGVYAFLLNPQGHILGDLYAYNRGEAILVDTDRKQAEKIISTFDHYIIMDDIEVKDLTDSLTSLGVAGPKSREILAAAGIAVPEAKPLEIFEITCACDCDCVPCAAVRAENPAYGSYELWLAPKDVKKTWEALLAHGAVPVGSEALEMHRIANGIPLYGVDIRERDLPQETEQARALNFNKGCYIGQEIVERVRSRGSVHRKFAGFIADAGQPIVAGTKIVSGEKEVGEITSVAFLRQPGAENNVALGYIRRELGVPGREVVIGGMKATIVTLPVPDSILRPDSTAAVARPA
ncbi:MAG TPA: glycine cleavage T C-terminal barrel domain-containing protein [Candidatus Sulfotelmatobacter sp.]|nr:glycine cleavage T C-terminal barrel domain-containing protein [Candidatus Sulfotelmatobacter sp.]